MLTAIILHRKIDLKINKYIQDIEWDEDITFKQ